jgi:hypothetical protein
VACYAGENAFAAGIRAIASGTSSVALGEDTVASGAASVALGFGSHTNARQGSFVFGDRSTPDEVRAGVNHSATWRTSGGFRIFTSSNLSTGVTLQSGASVGSWGQANAVISTSTGAYLSTAGVWENVSDVNRKHAFARVDREEILARLRALPIGSWSYLVEPEHVRHIGPTSQDFHSAFGLGQDVKSIGSVDADGIALAAAKALEQRTSDQLELIEALQKENSELHRRLERLESSLKGDSLKGDRTKGTEGIRAGLIPSVPFVVSVADADVASGVVHARVELEQGAGSSSSVSIPGLAGQPGVVIIREEPDRIPLQRAPGFGQSGLCDLAVPVRQCGRSHSI